MILARVLVRVVNTIGKNHLPMKSL
jgi:hypothetical protein